MRFRALAAARPARARSLAVRAIAGLVVAGVLGACGTSPGSQRPGASGLTASGPATSSGAISSVPATTPVPVATPQPTPQYTNSPDRDLSRLIPGQAGGARVVVPPVGEFAYTPGDVAEAFGELGLRFTALQVAYIQEPRLSLFAMRVAPPEVSTEELEPYLEEAGRYVGIAGLVREPWKLETIGRRVSWVRPEDNATALGTHIYLWADGAHVFLMIGVDDKVNRALFKALPGGAAPTATPRPSRTPRATPTATPSGSADSS